MMSWNYRILDQLDEETNPNPDPRYIVIEAYYDENNKLDGYCEAEPPQGDTITELVKDSIAQKDAYLQPILTNAYLREVI